MPSLILTTFAPFEQFAHAESSEGALFIFSPSKHAPLFAFWIFYWKACWVYLVFERCTGSTDIWSLKRLQDHKAGMLVDVIKLEFCGERLFFGNLSEKSFCSLANAKLILTSWWNLPPRAAAMISIFFFQHLRLHKVNWVKALSSFPDCWLSQIS